MKSETLLGAAIAAVILFLTGMLALLSQDGVTAISDISQLSWIILGVGALIGFGKDMQALSVRRGLANMTNSGNQHGLAPWLAVPILALLLGLGSCGINRPPMDSVADGIAVTAADVETAAQTVKRLCGNTQPGGPCANGAMLSTDQKESLKNGLQDVLDGLSVANLALATGNTTGAMDGLARTQAILAVLSAELARLQN